MSELTIVFVHGYSVTSFDTYGQLPLRIQNEALARGYSIHIEDVFLGRYITFNDAVQISDVAKALEYAVKQQIPNTKRFVAITHSTGGPVVRTWWRDFYQKKNSVCPMSHLIMLAPANHGSALAQLGKSRLSRVRSWFEGLQPGQGILDWLELGSNDAWELNKDWIFNEAKYILETGVFPFVVTGQTIDRKLYDHINSYTGESGSDGVIRVSSANINTRYLQLEQQGPQLLNNVAKAENLEVANFTASEKTPLRILVGKSHSGDDMGIMRSVKKDAKDLSNKELVDVIFECIAVNDAKTFETLRSNFEIRNIEVQQQLKIETVTGTIRRKHYIHDRYAMVIFRVSDFDGNAINDFDLIITGDDNDPDQLPEGFFIDRQCNRISKNTLTYYFNVDILRGCDALVDENNEMLRPAIKGLSQLGLKIIARPHEGFIRYLPCKIEASRDLFQKVIKENSTTLVDIYLQRIVSDENFRFEKTNAEAIKPFSYKDIKPGENFVQ